MDDLKQQLTSFFFEETLIESPFKAFNRPSILLMLQDEKGRKAQGEISPLPFHSKESVKEAKEQLSQVKEALLKQHFPYVLPQGLFPSVAFGVESALLDLFSPLQEKLSCTTYAFFMGDVEEIIEKAHRSFKKGFQEAKVKLGSFTEEQAHKVIAALSPYFRLRLDFNRKWELKDSIQFMRHYPEHFFVYTEEPAKNPQELALCPFPFALDETLRDYPDWKALLPLKQCTTLILKPSLTYPLSSFLRLNKKIVLTSSFEGEVGILQLKKLIHRLHFEKEIHGFDTL